MARINGNRITEGFTGMFARQVVFKTRLGTRYAAGPPRVNKKRKPTPNQVRVQRKMKVCNKYAFFAITDANVKQAYAAAATGGQTAVNVAFKDAWHPPVVHSIIANAYRGNPGDFIFVQASDDFKVASVKVSIVDNAGALIESGEAVLQNALWMYAATVRHEAPARIVATAIDLPRNEGTLEVELNTIVRETVDGRREN
jgi:hypothetical protein